MFKKILSRDEEVGSVNVDSFIKFFVEIIFFMNSSRVSRHCGNNQPRVVISLEYIPELNLLITCKVFKKDNFFKNSIFMLSAYHNCMEHYIANI